MARRVKAGGIQCSDLQKLAHAVWQRKYHIIWCPKYRFRILRGALQKSVGEILYQLCEWKKLEVLEMNVQEDHVHVVLSIPPKFSAKGYCVSTVGLDEEKVRQYVKWQQIKDRRMEQLKLWE